MKWWKIPEIINEMGGDVRGVDGWVDRQSVHEARTLTLDMVFLKPAVSRENENRSQRIKEHRRYYQNGAGPS